MSQHLDLQVLRTFCNFIYKSLSTSARLPWLGEWKGRGRGMGEQEGWGGWKGATQAAGIRKQNAAQASEKLMASKKKIKYCSSATGSNRQQQQQQQTTATTTNDSNSNNKRQQPTTTTTRGRRRFSGCRVRKHADGPSKVLAVTREW